MRSVVTSAPLVALILSVGCGSDEDPETADLEADADTDADSDADPLDFGCADEDGGSAVPLTWSGTTLGTGDDRTSYCSREEGGEDHTFLFTAPSDGTYVFDSKGTTFDHILSTFASCGGYESTCDASGILAEVVVPLSAGQQILVGIDTYTPGEEGAFTIYGRLATASEIACDDDRDDDLDALRDCLDPDCDTAPNCAPECPDQLAEAVPGTVEGSTIGRPDESKGSCDISDGDAPDASIAFVAPRIGRYGFRVVAAFDTVLSLQDGCDGAERMCSDLFGYGRETVGADLQAGESVTVVVDGYAGAAGDYELEVFEANRVEICDDGADDDADGQTDCADADCLLDPACNEDCTNGLDDDADGQIDCLDSYCASLPECLEDCADLSDDNGDGLVDCADPTCSADPLCAPICPEEVVPADQPLPLVLVGSTLGANDDQAGCVGNPDTSDRTFAFTAPADGTYTFDTLGSSFDTVLYVLDGCGGATLACNDDQDYAGMVYQSEVQVALAAGQSVVVVVDGDDRSAAGDFLLNVQ